MSEDDLHRRDILRGAAITLAALLSDRGLAAGRVSQDEDDTKFAGPPVKAGLVGLGPWGRELLASLTRLPSVEVVGVCDTYAAALKRGAEAAPKAQAVDALPGLLALPGLEAVIVATPSHQHKDVVLAALQSGKHVYCEAPLASTIDDARAIAMAAQQHAKLVFQAGLQGRANALWQHVENFVQSGVLGDTALVKSQWNRKESWRRAAPTEDRERAVNWRLRRNTSSGLPGEIGIHQIDLMTRYLTGRPTAVSGSGATMAWRDGREIPDTVHLVFEYPRDVRAIYTATLASSFGGAYTAFQGSNGSLFVKERRAWLIKEADSALLGWEVHAHKEPVHDDTGIALVADATKILAEGREPGKEDASKPERDAVYLALQRFARSVRNGGTPVVGAAVGFEATVVAIKAHEATLAGSRIELSPELFTIA